jgi:hypothetical protein
MVISRALVEIFANPVLADSLALRGGTALSKLHVRPPARYSEDIDLVQTTAGPAGPMMQALRTVLEPWLGKAKWKQGEGRITFCFRFTAEGAFPVPMKRAHSLSDDESTTRLGDWYSNNLHLGRRHCLLFVSERTRLPVAIPIREARHLATVFPDTVCAVLAAVGVPALDIAEERARMSEMAFGRTKSRSLLGTMTDYAIMARHVDARRAEPETPEELMHFLAQTPILPLDGARPIDMTLAAFGVTQHPA